MKKYKLVYGMRSGCFIFTGQYKKVEQKDKRKAAVQYVSVRCDCGQEGWRRRYTFVYTEPVSCPNCKTEVFGRGEEVLPYKLKALLLKCEQAWKLFINVPLRPKLSTRGKFV